MISETDIEEKVYYCVLDDIANKLFTVGSHILLETDSNIGDSSIGRGWFCILNDAVNDLGTISKALRDDERKS